MKKNLSPGVDFKLTKTLFDNFNNGTIQDTPSSEIKDGFSNSENITAFTRYFEGRTGCKRYGVPIPDVENRTGYNCYKSGNLILSNSGNVFELSDVGNYFNWNGSYELIAGYIDGSTVIGSDNIERTTDNGSIAGMPNLFTFHSMLRMWFVLSAGKLFYADIGITEWNSVFCISKNTLSEARSDCVPHKKSLIIFTSNGMFKADIDTGFPIIYKINVPVPTVKIIGNEDSEDTDHSYGYLYSCTRIGDNGNFVDRQASVSIDIETGTNLPDETDIDSATIHTENEVSETNGITVETLWVPKVSDESEEYERHLTHFTIWRTEDLEAKDVDDVYKEKFNNPNRFIWNKDLRICAAFYVSIADGICTALVGDFEAADRYSVLELADGQRLEIYEVIDSKHVSIEPEYYNSTLVYTGAAAIGYGRIIEGIITGGTLTITDGDTLTEEDTGKTLWSSEGFRLYIISVLSAASATVHTDITLTTQGFTLDATHRNYYDVVPDTMLHARKDFYTCINRFRRPLPNCNIGVIIPGFVVCARRGESDIYYSHLEDGYSQLMGQYIPNIQISENIKDSIQGFWVFESVVSIFCSTITCGVTIGISEFTTLPSSTEQVALLSAIKIIDKHRGCLDIDSIAEVENGTIALITNEPGGESLRLFNGMSYSEQDYLVDNNMGGRITKEMQHTIKKSISVYDGQLGYVLWRKYKEE